MRRVEGPFDPRAAAYAIDELRQSKGWEVLRREIETVINSKMMGLITSGGHGKDTLLEIGRYQGAITSLTNILALPDKLFNELLPSEDKLESEEIPGRIPRGL